VSVCECVCVRVCVLGREDVMAFTFGAIYRCVCVYVYVCVCVSVSE